MVLIFWILVEHKLHWVLVRILLLGKAGLLMCNHGHLVFADLVLHVSFDSRSERQISFSASQTVFHTQGVQIAVCDVSRAIVKSMYSPGLSCACTLGHCVVKTV